MPHITPLLAAVVSACAATTPAPRLSPADPADPTARESSTAPVESALGSPPHEAAPPASEDVYSCPMHPEVRETEPGTCRLCGMTLVKKVPEENRP